MSVYKNALFATLNPINLMMKSNHEENVHGWKHLGLLYKVNGFTSEPESANVRIGSKIWMESH